MTIPIIKIKVFRKSVVKARMDVRFPANVITENFLKVTKANGTYTFDIDYTQLAATPIIDPTTAVVAVLDETAAIYKIQTLAQLLVSGLDADLQAIAALSSTGVLSRTAANTWVLRSITGTANEITLTNGDGVAGAPTVSLPAALTFTGKTIAGGTFNSPALVTPALGTPASGILTNATGLPISTGLNGAGTGVLTALGVNVGTAGSPVVNGGALGTPSSGVATNLTGTASGLTAGHVTTNANLTGDVTSVGNAATISALANSKLATMAAFSFKGNNTGSSATPTDVTIGGLTAKASPAGTDLILISDQAASGAWKQASISSVASAGSVSSIAGNTGAFTLSHGITNSTNDIQLAVGQLPGTTTSGNASAGNIGEFVTSSVLLGSPVSLSNGVATNITSISLTAGDWDVSGLIGWNGAASTTVTSLQGGASTTTGTLVLAQSTVVPYQSATVFAGGEEQHPIPQIRVSISSTTTVYLVAQANFGTSTANAYGTISARRAR